MSRAYDYWIHQQLEPDDVLITGNRRRYKELPGFMQARESAAKMAEIELRSPQPEVTFALQDEWLKNYEDENK